MLVGLGFLVLAVCSSIIIYKVFFAYRKKHIGSGNIFYLTTNGTYQESLEISAQHQDNLQVLMLKITEQEYVQEGILVHEFTNKSSPFAHKILVKGMPVGHLDAQVAEELQKEKIELGIHSGVIYCKVHMRKNAQGKVESVTVDLPKIAQLSKVLSNRSFEHSAEKFSRLK